MSYRQKTADGWQDWPRSSEMGLTMAVPPGRMVGVHATRIDLSKTSSHRAIDEISIYPDGSPPSVSIGDGTIRGKGDYPAPYIVRENSGGKDH